MTYNNYYWFEETYTALSDIENKSRRIADNETWGAIGSSNYTAVNAGLHTFDDDSSLTGCGVAFAVA